MENGKYRAIMINTIGMAILVDAFKCASKMFGDTTNLVKRNLPSLAQNVYTYNDASDSLAFIKGTGLEIVLHEYMIPLNSHSLRTTFFTVFGERGHIE